MHEPVSNMHCLAEAIKSVKSEKKQNIFDSLSQAQSHTSLELIHLFSTKQSHVSLELIYISRALNTENCVISCDDEHRADTEKMCYRKRG